MRRERCSFPCKCVTVGLPRGASAAESHDDGSESQAPLHAVLPDALQDVERKVDVQVTQEHDAVAVLQEEAKAEVFGTRQAGAFDGNCWLMGDCVITETNLRRSGTRRLSRGIRSLSSLHEPAGHWGVSDSLFIPP